MVTQNIEQILTCLCVFVPEKPCRNRPYKLLVSWLESPPVPGDLDHLPNPLRHVGVRDDTCGTISDEHGDYEEVFPMFSLKGCSSPVYILTIWNNAMILQIIDHGGY